MEHDLNYEFEGILIRDNKKSEIPAVFSLGSRFSLLIRVSDEYDLKDGELFNEVIVNVKNLTYTFGPCRLLVKSDFNNSNGCLIFISNLYDFIATLVQGKNVSLTSMKSEIYYYFDQKNSITQPFREYISDFSYQLNLFQNFFDEIELKINAEPEYLHEYLEKTLIETEGRQFIKFFNQRLIDMEDIIKDFNKKEHENHGFFLRRQFWNFIIESAIMYRTNIKPRGYAGDSMMMNMIYDNDFVGKSIFAKLLYKTSLEHPASEAVRNRRIMIPKILKKILKNHKNNNSVIHIMSIACGSSRELYEIFKKKEDALHIKFTLLDQDPHALKDSLITVNKIEKIIGKKLNIAFLKESVRTMLNKPDLINEEEQFDYIYSMGLFDYLSEPVARAVLEKIFYLLKPGGYLLIGNFHVSNKSRWFMEYWHDWVLYYRTEEEFISILENVNAENIDVIYEKTGSQMFLVASRPVK